MVWYWQQDAPSLGALALTAATAAAHLGEEVKYIHTFASGNIIKMLIPLVSGYRSGRHRICCCYRRNRSKTGKTAAGNQRPSAEQIQQASDMVKQSC